MNGLKHVSYQYCTSDILDMIEMYKLLSGNVIQF